MKKLFSLFLTLVAFFAVVSCTTPKEEDNQGGSGNQGGNQGGNENTGDVWTDDGVQHTYNTYTTISPSNWNELTYQDNNDTQIMSYIGSSFFQFNYKFDEYGQIVPGDFTVEYAAATKLEDVTADYVGDKWGIAEGATAQAYKITLRENLKWDDGTAITAADFVYSMQEQLNPLFQNYRADSYYVGNTIIHNAMGYAKQGQSSWYAADSIYTKYVPEEQDAKIVFSLAPSSDEVPAQASFRGSMGFPASYHAAATAAYLTANYLGGTAFTNEVAAKMEGKTMAEIKADEEMAAAWAALIGWWQTDPDEELDFFITHYQFPEMTFDQVGIFVGETPYELVVVLDKALPLLKEDGSLSYHASYEFSSLPLVHKGKYEANKVAPAEGGTLWTSTYNSDVETTASWGPYRLVSFQTGKQYVLERNLNWYGYNTPGYAGQYETDKIVCDTIGEWGTAWLQFLKGNIDGIGIDVSVAQDYKHSERAYFTSSDFVASLQLQSDKEQLKAREEEGINKTIMAYADFRQALSLSIDRDEFASLTTTSSLAGYGLFNSMHYYDVENGKVYRNEDVAKEVLCEVYGVDVSKYGSLEEAYEAISGYNLDLARQLVNKAYDEALAAGDIHEGDVVKLTLGTGAINEVVTRRFDYIKAAWTKMVEGTKLEGRLEFEVKDFSDQWSNDFRNGKYDVCMGGWTGAAWNPGYFLLAYLSPDYMYSKAWATDKEMLEFTMPGEGENGADLTETKSLIEWYEKLNGEWGQGRLEESKRLLLIAALEKAVLKAYYSVPLYNEFSASLLSYKMDYISYEYNTFMGYGGIRYMTYNYSDAEWEAAVEANGGEIDYRK